MPGKRSHADIVDLGKIKVHPASGTVGMVVDESYPHGQYFSQYRLVLQQANGERGEFLFMELRDATPAEETAFKKARPAKPGV